MSASAKQKSFEKLPDFGYMPFVKAPFCSSATLPVQDMLAHLTYEGIGDVAEPQQRFEEPHCSLVQNGTILAQENSKN